MSYLTLPMPNETRPHRETTIFMHSAIVSYFAMFVTWSFSSTSPCSNRNGLTRLSTMRRPTRSLRAESPPPSGGGDSRRDAPPFPGFHFSRLATVCLSPLPEPSSWMVKYKLGKSSLWIFTTVAFTLTRSWPFSYQRESPSFTSAAMTSSTVNSPFSQAAECWPLCHADGNKRDTRKLREVRARFIIGLPFSGSISSFMTDDNNSTLRMQQSSRSDLRDRSPSRPPRVSNS
mmetsp:Transcript_21519/g.46021  ORF Transcript_21519/g.46021 Transcript_21519/m.46021 type:complete len:231 (-) Transcript_21519:1999-2691(-)